MSTATITTITTIRHPKTLLAGIFVMNGIEFLQSGMIAFAAGPIMGEISASPEQYSLMAALYACIAVAVIARLQWYVERLGWRRYVQISIAVFIAGATIVAGSHHFWQFLVGRAVMALGGAAFMTSARGMINLIPPGPKRFSGIAAFATSLAIGNAAAPWVASAAVTRESWRLMFGVLITLALLAAVFATICLPSERTPPALRTRTRALPMMALVGGTFLVLYALQRSNYDYHGGSARLPVFLVLGVLAIALFVRSQLRQERPLLLLRELMQWRYLFGLAIFTLCYFILGATNYMLPVLTQRAFGFSWEVVGRIQGLGLLSAVIGFAIMAKIMQRYPSPKKFYVAGFGSLFLFGWRLSVLNGNASLWSDVLPALVFYGPFIMLVMATTALHAFRDLQSDETVFSHGQQVKNMLSQFGVGLGVAFASVGFQWRFTKHYAVLNARFVAGDTRFVEALQKLTAFFSPDVGTVQASQLAMGQLAQQLNQQATLLTGVEFFRLLMWAGAACAGLMCVQRTLK